MALPPPGMEHLLLEALRGRDLLWRPWPNDAFKEPTDVMARKAPSIRRKEVDELQWLSPPGGAGRPER